MGQKFCTGCGAPLPEGKKFCEQCGFPVAMDPAGTALQPGVSPVAQPIVPAGQKSRSTRTYAIAAGLFLVLAIAAGIFFTGIPVLPGAGQSGGSSGAVSPAIPVTPDATAPVPASITTLDTPVPKPDPFPGALRLNDRLPFGTGPVASEATVYNYWINDTYEWHNDNDNHYYVQTPRPGYKYLFVFIHLVNVGDTRVWFPPAGRVVVQNAGIHYYQDQNHFKPNKVSDLDAVPVEVKEVQYFQKLNGDEYAEDFGFSHGTELGYLYPGKSNAVDGYIIYEVLKSLEPEETYVVIPFNGQDQGVWKLG